MVTLHLKSASQLIRGVSDDKRGSGVSERTCLSLWYLAAGVLFVAGSRFRGVTAAWDDFLFFHYIAPVGIATAAVGATRRAFPVARAVEVVAAAGWSTTLLCLVLWPAYADIPTIGLRVTDGVALVFGVTACVLWALAVQVLSGNRIPRQPLVARTLQALGHGVLGVYCGRLSFLSYTNTRLTRTGGLAAVSWELDLHIFLFIAAIAALLGSAIVAWKGRPQQPSGSDELR